MTDLINMENNTLNSNTTCTFPSGFTYLTIEATEQIEVTFTNKDNVLIFEDNRFIELPKTYTLKKLTKYRFIKNDQRVVNFGDEIWFYSEEKSFVIKTSENLEMMTNFKNYKVNGIKVENSKILSVIDKEIDRVNDLITQNINFNELTGFRFNNILYKKPIDGVDIFSKDYVVVGDVTVRNNTINYNSHEYVLIDENMIQIDGKLYDVRDGEKYKKYWMITGIVLGIAAGGAMSAFLYDRLKSQENH